MIRHIKHSWVATKSKMLETLYGFIFEAVPPFKHVHTIYSSANNIISSITEIPNVTHILKTDHELYQGVGAKDHIWLCLLSHAWTI